MRLPALLSVTILAATFPAAGTVAQTTRPAGPGQPAAPPASNRLVRQIELAHHKAAWDARRAISFDILLTFGDATMLAGTVLYEMDTGRARIDLAAETRLVFDGEKAWVSPASAEMPRARFHLLTWPYFIAAPMKLSDPGTRVSAPALRPLRDKLCQTAKLTFEPGVGDSPDDWYVLYADPATERLLAMAYIVTYGKPRADAEQEPHAIVYDDYQMVDGIPISMDWTFHDWDEQQGVRGEPLGRARLSHVRFVEPREDAFDRPADAREDAVPGG